MFWDGLLLKSLLRIQTEIFYSFQTLVFTFLDAYIKLVQAYKIIFLDVGDVVVLEVNDQGVFSDLLGDGDLTC